MDNIIRTPEHQKAFNELKAILDEAQAEGLKYGFDSYKHYRELFALEEAKELMHATALTPEQDKKFRKSLQAMVDNLNRNAVKENEQKR